MERKEYNGWYNYETWLAALWFDNDGEANMFREDAQRIYTEALSDNDNDTSKAFNDTVSSLADNIKEYVEENMPEQESGFITDLLNSALSEINWYEIAKHYVEEID